MTILTATLVEDACMGQKCMRGEVHPGGKEEVADLALKTIDLVHALGLVVTTRKVQVLRVERFEGKQGEDDLH